MASTASVFVKRVEPLLERPSISRMESQEKNKDENKRIKTTKNLRTFIFPSIT